MFVYDDFWLSIIIIIIRAIIIPFSFFCISVVWPPLCVPWAAPQHNNQSKGMDINVTGLWERNITGTGVTVVVVDDGVEHTLEDIQPNYVRLTLLLDVLLFFFHCAIDWFGPWLACGRLGGTVGVQKSECTTENCLFLALITNYILSHWIWDMGTIFSIAKKTKTDMKCFWKMSYFLIT